MSNELDYGGTYTKDYIYGCGWRSIGLLPFVKPLRFNYVTETSIVATDPTACLQRSDVIPYFIGEDSQLGAYYVIPAELPVNTNVSELIEKRAKVAWRRYNNILAANNSWTTRLRVKVRKFLLQPKFLRIRYKLRQFLTNWGLI